MSRTIQIEVNAKNVSLLVVALLLCGGLGFLLLKSDRLHEHGPGPDQGEHRASAEKLEENRLQLSPEALANAHLELLESGAGEVNVSLSLPGEVSLNQEKLAHVTPRVPGTAREVRKQLGEVVKKGEVLATLDSRDLAEAQREFLATKERLALAEATFQRAELLQKENISAEKDYLAAKQAVAEARIDHKSAAQKLQAIGGSGGGGGGYALVAPLDGTIIEKHISVGEVLSEQTRAFTIADLSSIWVNVTVYAKDLPRVKVGQAAEVRAEGIEVAARGSIDYLGQLVGEQTRSATARVVLTNPGPAWRPGLFATAEVALERSAAAVVIDDDAVQTIDGKPSVFVQDGAAFEVRRVTLGRKGTRPGQDSGHVVEILDGLKAGERYVAKNSFILKAELGKSDAGHDH